MGSLRAVGFDLDGTLFDHRGAAAAGATAFVEGLGAVATADVLRAWSTAEHEQFERWRRGEIDFREQRRERLRAVLPMIGHAVPTDPGRLDTLFEDYLHAYRAAWTAFPGSAALLRELRTRGFRLGLLTNGTEEQQRDKLVRVGLDGAFDVVCTSERIGVQKPGARAFTTLAEELDVDPSDCLFVGDSIEHDVVGARGAGMRAVLVDHAAAGGADVRSLVTSAIAAALTEGSEGVRHRLSGNA